MRVMGHAGAWAAPGEADARAKWKALENAGATMVDHPAKFGSVLKSLLSSTGRDVLRIQQSAAAASQKRGYHTSRRPQISKHPPPPSNTSQKRPLYLRPDQSAALLKDYGIEASASAESNPDSRLLVLTIDRTARSPCIIASPTTSPSGIYKRSVHIPFDYRRGPSEKEMVRSIQHLQLDACPPKAQAAAANLIKTLWQIFHEKEAVSLSTHIAVSPSQDKLEISDLDFTFDVAAFKSSKRQTDLHKFRDTSLEDAVEVSAEPDGIVYIKLDGSERNIGTLVNGAGLAMNTVDALALHGGWAANFLDTGGKATSETVKRSFELILQDERVKVIFVNIFGGLTLGDMIAKGVLLAFKELDVGSTVPVVVRIRGTNEKEGQMIIEESGLDLFAYDDFEKAAEKVVELANK
jgi:succinyl-CoA synthetase alpha subunit